MNTRIAEGPSPQALRRAAEYMVSGLHEAYREASLEIQIEEYAEPGWPAGMRVGLEFVVSVDSGPPFRVILPFSGLETRDDRTEAFRSVMDEIVKKIGEEVHLIRDDPFCGAYR